MTFCIVDATARNILDRAFDAIIVSGCLHGVPAGHKKYLESVLAWSRPQTKFIILVPCIKRTPADRLKQVETLSRHISISCPTNLEPTFCQGRPK